MCAAPFAVGSAWAAEASPSVGEQVFVERLRALVEGRKWPEAMRHIQQAQALRPPPPWLAARDGDVRLAQIRIGLGQRDLPGVVNAARLFVNGDEARSQQALEIARAAHAAGDPAPAIELVREIVHRAPKFLLAQRVLAEWEPAAAAERKSPAERKPAVEARPPPERKAPPSEEDEATVQLARLRTAREEENLPAMRTAARLFLTGDHGRAFTLLEVAREYFGRGDKATALTLTREVLRRTPGFPPAQRQLAEFEAAEKK